MSNAKMLVFALPANGRSIPFYAHVVPKLAGEGALIEAEDKALQALKGICARRSHVTVVADRGFGNKRWLGAVCRAGFHFVQRISSVFTIDTERFIGGVKEMNLRRGAKIRDWGMSLDRVNLKDYRRYERFFYIVALAFTILSAHGALAETEGVDRQAKANTRTTRVLNLLRIGIYYNKRRGKRILDVVEALKVLTTKQAAPNWG